MSRRSASVCNSSARSDVPTVLPTARFSPATTVEVTAAADTRFRPDLAPEHIADYRAECHQKTAQIHAHDRHVTLTSHRRWSRGVNDPHASGRAPRAFEGGVVHATALSDNCSPCRRSPR